MLDGTIVKLDNVSYGSFPTVNVLNKLSTNLVLSFVDFLRTIGINDREQMAETFKSSPEDIEHLCIKCRLNPEANKKETIERYIEMRKEWQRKVLCGSTQQFEVDIMNVLERARKRSPFYKLDAFTKEVQYYLVSFLRRTAGNAGIKATINYDLISQVLANCRLEPIYSWEKAHKNKSYIRELLTESFPHTPVSVIANYLFVDDKPMPQEITYFCLQHNIHREASSNTSYFEEQIAFAKWTGYDVKQFITERAEKDSPWRRYL